MFAGGEIMDNRNTENRALVLLETIKPELLKILGSAPAFGSCGMDIHFHNSEIVRLNMKAEISKVKAPDKSPSPAVVRK
jgi:hypothetical protein